MSRIQEFLDIVEGRRTAPLEGESPEDTLLRAVLAHTAVADGTLAPAERALLQPLFPRLGPAAVERWLAKVSGQPFDYEALLAAFPRPEDRDRLVRLATAMSDVDGPEGAGGEDSDGQAVELAFVDVLRAMVAV